MKLSKIMLAVAALGLVGVANAAEDQGSGTVTFTGSIVKAPCSISSDTQNQTIEMGAIGNKILEKGGKSSSKPFNIKLEDCDIEDLTTKTVTATFTGTTSSGSADRFALTGGQASGAGLVLASGDAIILPGVATMPQPLKDLVNVLSFAAYLQGDDTTGGTPVVPGAFNTITTFALAYQ